MADIIEYVLRVKDGATPTLTKVSKETKETGENAKKAGSAFGKMGSTASTTFTEILSGLQLIRGAVEMTVGSVASLTASFIKGGAELEGLQQRLSVLLGDEQGAARFQELFDFGASTPFEVTDLVEAEVNLRALGLAAEDILPDVANFAGAMGVEIPQAAVELGRAMQFGAGAVETIAGRALRAQVELNTGQEALKMSTEDFREAVVEVLRMPTEEGGKFAGGMERLSSTLSGKISNLQDEWTKFVKQVNDAGLFAGVKNATAELLVLFDENRAMINGMAKMLSGTLLTAIEVVIMAVSTVVTSWLKAQMALNGFVGLINVLPAALSKAISAILDQISAINDRLGDPLGLSDSLENAKASVKDFGQVYTSSVQSALQRGKELKDLIARTEEGTTALLAGLDRGRNMMQGGVGAFTGTSAQGGGPTGTGGGGLNALFAGSGAGDAITAEAAMIARIEAQLTKASAAASAALGTQFDAEAQNLARTVADVRRYLSEASVVIGMGTEGVADSLTEFSARLAEQSEALGDARSSFSMGGGGGGGGALSGILGAVSGIAGALSGGLTGILTATLGPIGTLLSAIVGILGGGGDGFAELLDSIAEMLFNVLLAVPDLLGRVIPDFVAGFIPALLGMLGPLVEAILVGAADLVVGLILAIDDIIVAIIKAVPAIVVGLIDGLGQLLVGILVQMPIKFAQGIERLFREGIEFGLGDAFKGTSGSVAGVRSLLDKSAGALAARDRAGDVYLDGRKVGETFRTFEALQNFGTT